MNKVAKDPWLTLAFDYCKLFQLLSIIDIEYVRIPFCLCRMSIIGLYMYKAVNYRKYVLYQDLRINEPAHENMYLWIIAVWSGPSLSHYENKPIHKRVILEILSSKKRTR